MRVGKHMIEILQESLDEEAGLIPNRMGGSHIRRKHRIPASRRVREGIVHNHARNPIMASMDAKRV